MNPHKILPPVAIDLDVVNTKIKNLIKQAEIEQALDEVIQVTEALSECKRDADGIKVEENFIESVRDLLAENKEFNATAKKTVTQFAAILVAEGLDWKISPKPSPSPSLTDRQDLIGDVFDFAGRSDYKQGDAQTIVGNILALLQDSSLTDVDVSNIAHLGVLASIHFDFGAFEDRTVKETWIKIGSIALSPADKKEKEKEQPKKADSPTGARFRLQKPAMAKTDDEASHDATAPTASVSAQAGVR